MQFLLIGHVALGHNLCIQIIRLGSHRPPHQSGSFLALEIVLRMARSFQFCIHLHFENSLHQESAVRPINDEVACSQYGLVLDARCAHTHGMEGCYCQIFGPSFWVLQPFSPTSPRRLIGKGNGKDIPRIDHLLINQVGDTYQTRVLPNPLP